MDIIYTIKENFGLIMVGVFLLLLFFGIRGNKNGKGGNNGGGSTGGGRTPSASQE